MKLHPNDLKECWKESKLLDVRTLAEFEAKHLEGSTNIPLANLSLDSIKAGGIKEEDQIILICQSGIRANKALEKLTSLGFKKLYCLDGGLSACGNNNFKFKLGSKSISIERQVRIVAGALILLSTFVGYLFFPSLHWLSAAIGAGLAFSGITNTCGLALVLAKMPWNNKKSSCAC